MTPHICPVCGHTMHTIYSGKVLYCQHCKNVITPNVGDIRRNGETPKDL